MTSLFLRCVAPVAGAAALALCSALPVSAHHGWSGYLDEAFQITGTVDTAVSLAGPHATMRVKTKDGKVWNVMLAPGPRTESAGLKEATIPPGATVTAHGHRHRDPNKFEIKTERVTWGTKTFNVYPNRS